MKVAAPPASRPPIRNNSSLSNTRNQNSTEKINSNDSLSKTDSSRSNNQNNEQHGSALLNDPSLILLRNKFFEAGPDVDFDFSMLETPILEKFNRHLREYKQDCALSHNYDDAKLAADLSKLMSQEMQRRNYANYYSTEKKSSLPSSKATSIRNSRCESIRKYDFNISSETESQNSESSNFYEAGSNGHSAYISLYNSEDAQEAYLNHFNEETEEKRSDLLKLHEQQVERFENVWSTQMPNKYRKPSARLLELKEKEKALALSRDYDQAEIIHKEAEKLMIKEVNEAQQRLITDYKNAKEQLMAKQKKEMEIFEEKRKDKRDLLMVKLNERKEAEERREQVINEQQMTTMKLAEELQIDLYDSNMNDTFDETKSTQSSKTMNRAPRPTTASMMSMAYRASRTNSSANSTASSRNGSRRQTLSRTSQRSFTLPGKSRACPVQHKRKVVITFEEVSESQNEYQEPPNAENNIETASDENQTNDQTSDQSNDNPVNQENEIVEEEEEKGIPIEEVNEEEEEEKEKAKKCKCLLI